MTCDWYIVGTYIIKVKKTKKAESSDSDSSSEEEYEIEILRQKENCYPDIFEGYTEEEQEDPEILELLESKMEEQMANSLLDYPKERIIYKDGKIVDEDIDEECVMSNVNRDYTLKAIYERKFEGLDEDEYYSLLYEKVSDKYAELKDLATLDIVEIVEKYEGRMNCMFY